MFCQCSLVQLRPLGRPGAKPACDIPCGSAEGQLTELGCHEEEEDSRTQSCPGGRSR